MNSEHWHEISNSILSVRRGVKFSRHLFQGKVYYVISIETTNQHIKISVDTYLFLKTFDGVMDLCSVRSKFNKGDGRYISQADCITLIQSLADKSFFQTDSYLEYARINDDTDSIKEQLTSVKWINFLFFQQSLFSPNFFLKSTYPFIAVFFSWFAVALYILFMGLSIWLLLPNLDKFNSGINGILSNSNLPWVFVVVIISKVFHELAHGFTCIKYGKQVTTMGVMFLVFTPLPFVDVSSIWSLPSKFKRICVASAGMICDSLMGSIALIIWLQTSDGLINDLAFNTVFITFVSTLFFNLNPLVRFDGYHILSDLLEIPNLQSKSSNILTYLWNYGIGGERSEGNPARNRRELYICTVYGVLSFFYKIFLMLSIAYILSLKFLILGKIIAVFTVIYYIIKPSISSMKKAFSESRNPYYRKRMKIFYSLAVSVFLLIVLIPFPHYFKANGVISSAGKLHVYTEVGGHVSSLPFPNGSIVKKGDTLMTLENRDLADQLSQVANKIESARRKERAYASSPELLKLSKLEVSSLEGQLESLKEIHARGIIKSPSDGVLSYSSDLLHVGSYVKNGDPVLRVRDDKNLYFSAVVHQEESIYPFQYKAHRPEVKIYGLEDLTFSCSEMLSIPASSSHLPSASLGIMMGGEVSTHSEDPEGKKTLEGFFEMRGKIVGVDKHKDERLIQERRGKIRLYIGEKSLLSRFYRWGTQLIQKDHKV